MVKKLKRMSRKELRQPDEVMTRLHQIYEFLGKYRWHMIIAGVGLVVVLLAISFIVTRVVEGSRAVGAELASAMDVLQAPVLDPGNPVAAELRDQLGVKTIFESRTAKFNAAVEKLDAFLADHGSAKSAAVARLSVAAAKLELGEGENPEEPLAAYLDGRPEPRLAPVVMERLGIAAMNRSDVAGATEWFERMANSGVPYFVAVARGYLGDLANPNTPGIEGSTTDKAKAAEQYAAALAALTEGDRQVRGGERELTNEIERKLALLGVTP